MRSISLKLLLACAVLMPRALLPAGAPNGGVAVIANKGVPVGGLSAAALRDIYTGNKKYWENGQSVVIALVSGKAEDAAVSEVSGMDAGQFKTFWQRMVFSGRGQLPKKLDDAASLVAFVAATKGAIAIVSQDADLRDVARLQIK